MLAQRLGVLAAEQDVGVGLRGGPHLMARAGDPQVATPPLRAAQRDHPRPRTERAAVHGAPSLGVGIDVDPVEAPDEPEGPIEDENISLGLALVEHGGRGVPRVPGVHTFAGPPLFPAYE